MLVVVRHPDGVVVGSEYAKEIATHMDGKTQILNTRTIKEFVDAVKGHKPSMKQHLILLASHQDLGSDSLPTEIQRQLEWTIANKAGLVYGIESPGTLSTYVGPIEKNPERVAKNAYVSTYRAISARKELGTQFFGRLTQDPHTLIVGYRPRNVLKSGGIDRQIITSLPAQWGISNDRTKPSDWSGVAFIPVVAADKFQPVVDWLYDSANYVALGEKAHLFLEEQGIEHGAAPMPTGNGAFNNKHTTPNYGMLIRTVAKTHEIKLDWKP